MTLRFSSRPGVRPALFLLISICASPVSFVSAASVLDVGAQYRMRGISVGSPDYGASSNQNFAFYSQRMQAHLGGRFSPNIEVMTQIQALGVAGSTQAVTNLSAAPALNYYPNTTFTPWVQTAYLKATELYDYPVDVIIGRQPIMLGDGFILSDDELGFTGIRAHSRLPWYNLQAEAFTFKTADNQLNHSDIDIFGLQITKPYRQVRLQFLWLTERDTSGTTLYIRPSENTSDTTAFPTGTDFRASNITRIFYDARLEGRLLEGGFYKAEFAMQRGSVSRSSATLGSVDLSGFGLLLTAGLYTKTSKFGPIEVHGVLALGSGDPGDAGKDSSFHPSFGHRFDGLERSGFGEYFAATPYDAYPSTTNPNGLPAGNSGIRVLGGGVTTHPTALLSIGVDYFVYDSQETAIRSFPNAPANSSLGSEFDIGLGFAYTSYLNFRASFAFFRPGAAYPITSERAHRFLVEATGRF